MSRGDVGAHTAYTSARGLGSLGTELLADDLIAAARAVGDGAS